MTEKDKEIQSLRRELDWLMQSEAVRSFAKKDAHGKHLYDICGLDRCIKTLHSRLKTVEKQAQAAQAEAVYYRRRCEALVEDQAFPLMTNGGNGLQEKKKLVLSGLLAADDAAPFLVDKEG